MNCVKCGRETAEEQVFCDLCLGEMEHYPVKPGTAIHIPAQTPREENKKHQPKRKLPPTASEQLLRLKKKVRRLRVLLVLLLLLCAGLSLAVERAVVELDFQRLLGRNYRTEETVAQTEPTATELPSETAAP